MYDDCVLTIVTNINVEHVLMASIERSIKFRLSCYSNFTACKSLDALLSFVVELIGSASTVILFVVSKFPYTIDRKRLANRWNQ